jgi:hypothetical protein
MTQVTSDEEVGRQILGVILRNKIRPGGILRRNYFVEVRDADFQRGINKAIENNGSRSNYVTATHTNSQTRVLRHLESRSSS